MGRYSVGDRTGAGSTTLPIISLYAPAGSGGTMREIGVFNTTTTAVALMLVRMSTTGTQGAGLTEAEYNADAPPPLMTAFTTHTVTPTNTELGYRAMLGSAIGSGVIWTFGANGIVIPPGTGNGVGIIVATGTGQICDAYMVWDE